MTFRRYVALQNIGRMDLIIFGPSFNICSSYFIPSCHTVAWLEATVNKLGAAQNVNRCIYKGRGRLPRPSKSHLQKTKPNLQMALSGTGQSALSQVDTSVYSLGCAQLVNVSSNHAIVPPVITLPSYRRLNWPTTFNPTCWITAGSL